MAFYKPNYDAAVNVGAKDLRTTIHWETFISTDANGKANVSFYIADPKTTIKVLVEG